MFVAKRILIITNETKFALDVKKALERNGKVTVSIFSSGKAGIDYARSHSQDVAVVDFRMKDMPGTDMVDHLRTLQHDIAIIAAPNHTAIHDLQDRYNIQRIINIPMSIRKFVASLNTAKQDVIDKQPTNEKPPMLIEGLSVERSPQTMNIVSGCHNNCLTSLQINNAAGITLTIRTRPRHLGFSVQTK